MKLMSMRFMLLSDLQSNYDMTEYCPCKFIKQNTSIKDGKRGVKSNSNYFQCLYIAYEIAIFDCFSRERRGMFFQSSSPQSNIKTWHRLA